jgi:Fe2+ transport system protein B
MEETLENHKNRQRIEIFFDSLSKTGNINVSARAAKLGNGTVYNYKEKYEWFRNKMLESMSMFGDKLEGDAFNLIKKQMKEQDYKSNPALLIFLLKGAKPDKYQEHIKQDTTALQLIDEIKGLSKKAPKKREKKKKSVSQQAIEEANEILKDKGIGK